MLYVSTKTQSIFSSDYAGCIHMEAGVPRSIPNAMMSDALAKGVQPYIVEGRVVEEVEVDSVPAHMQKALDLAVLTRDAQLDSDDEVEPEAPSEEVEEESTVEANLHSAMEDVLARNRRSDFTPGGRPKLGILRDITGLTYLTTEQVDEAWASYNEA